MDMQMGSQQSLPQIPSGAAEAAAEPGAADSALRPSKSLSGEFRILVKREPTSVIPSSPHVVPLSPHPRFVFMGRLVWLAPLGHFLKGFSV